MLSNFIRTTKEGCNYYQAWTKPLETDDLFSLQGTDRGCWIKLNRFS